MNLPFCECGLHQVSYLCEEEECLGSFHCGDCFEKKHETMENHEKFPITEWLNNKFGESLKASLKEMHKELLVKYMEAESRKIFRPTDTQELQNSLNGVFRGILPFLLEQIKGVMDKTIYMFKVNLTRMMDQDSLVLEELEAFKHPSSLLLKVCGSGNNGKGLEELVKNIHRDSINLNSLVEEKAEYIENEMKVLMHSIKSVNFQKLTEKTKSLTMKNLVSCFEKIQEDIIQDSDLETQVKMMRSKRPKVSIPKFVNSPKVAKATTSFSSLREITLKRFSNSFSDNHNGGHTLSSNTLEEFQNSNKKEASLLSFRFLDCSGADETLKENGIEPGLAKSKPKPMMLSMISKASTMRNSRANSQKTSFNSSFKVQGNSLKPPATSRANSNGASFRKAIEDLRAESQKEEDEDQKEPNSFLMMSKMIKRSNFSAKSCILSSSEPPKSIGDRSRSSFFVSTPSIKPSNPSQLFVEGDENNLEEIVEENSFSGVFNKNKGEGSSSVILLSGIEREIVKIGPNGFMQGPPVQVETTEGELKAILHLTQEEDSNFECETFSSFSPTGTKESFLVVLAFEALNEPDNSLNVFDLKDNSVICSVSCAHPSRITMMELLNVNPSKKQFQFVSVCAASVFKYWVYSGEAKKLVMIQQSKHIFGILTCLCKPGAPQIVYNLISGGMEGRIACWMVNDIQVEATKKREKAHDKKINCVVRFNDDSFLTGGGDGVIKVWSYESLECSLVLRNNFPVFSILGLSPSCFVATSNDLMMKNFSLKVWSVKAQNPIQTLNRHKARIVSLKKTSSWGFLSIDKDKNIEYWKLSLDSSPGSPEISINLRTQTSIQRKSTWRKPKRLLRSNPSATSVPSPY